MMMGQDALRILLQLRRSRRWLVDEPACLLQGLTLDREELLREAAIMAQFVHPSVIRLVGVVTTGEPLMIVLEYAGTSTYLMRYWQLRLAFSLAEHGALLSYIKGRDLDDSTLVRFGIDCASGLQYLGQRGFVHR
jgi:serine/threonine protein kinase